MIEPLNNHVFVKPIKETKKVGMVDMITKYDEQDRYNKAEVVVSDPNVPLECCDIILYDKHNGHEFQSDDSGMLTVLHARDVVAKL